MQCNRFTCGCATCENFGAVHRAGAGDFAKCCQEVAAASSEDPTPKPPEPPAGLINPMANPSRSAVVQLMGGLCPSPLPAAGGAAAASSQAGAGTAVPADSGGTGPSTSTAAPAAAAAPQDAPAASGAPAGGAAGPTSARS